MCTSFCLHWPRQSCGIEIGVFIVATSFACPRGVVLSPFLAPRIRDARLYLLYAHDDLFSDRLWSNAKAFSEAYCAAYSTAYSTADCAKSKPNSTSNSTANGRTYHTSYGQAYLSSFTSAEQRPHPVSYRITHYSQTYSTTFTSPDGTSNLCSA